MRRLSFEQLQGSVMARQLSVKQCQGPECRALRASRDEAQSQVRSLETDIRILRSQLAEAVALLRDVAKRLDGYDGLCATRLRLVSQASTARSFLSRLDAAKGTK